MTKNLIANFEKCEINAHPSPYFWLDKIGLAAKNGDREAEKYLVGVMEKSIFRLQRKTALQSLLGIGALLPETREALDRFEKDPTNAVLFLKAESICRGGFIAA